MSDPKRLLDEPGELSPAERRALEAALGARPPSGAKRAVLGSVVASLPLPTGNAPSGLEGAGGAALTANATSGALGFVALVKPAAVGFALGIATTVGWVGLSSPGKVTGDPTTRSAESAQPAPSSTLPGRASGRLEDPERAPAPDDRAAPLASSGKTPSARKHEPPPSPLALGDTTAHAPSTRAFPDVDGALASTSLEGRRVAEARALLRSGKASAALTALTAIGTEFPRGALVQEREALTIEALLVAGRRDEARARAEQFLGRYPTSPHAAAARRALE